MSELNGTGAAPLDAFDNLPNNPEPEELEAALRAFREGAAKVDAIGRATLRAAAVKRIEKLGVPAPARTIDTALEGLGAKPGADGVSQKLTDPEPWEDPVDGGELLDEMVEQLSRHLVLPRYAAEALALWVLHTYTYDFGEVTPRLGVTSPERRCGKTKVMDILGVVCSRPIPASNISSAAVYRSIERWKPTLLIDEADSFLPGNEELRGVLNAGHHKSTAMVIRCDGEALEPRMFSTWAPTAIACIGSLPPTLEDRAIEIKMRRKARGEKVDRIRLRKLGEEIVEWRRRAVRWAKDSEKDIRCSSPALPEDIDDRARDNWEPLIALADLAGKHWPALARAAAKALSAGRDDSEGSRGVELLRDLRDVLGDREKMATDDILKALVALEERPWKEYGRKAKPLSARQLAALLKPYGVKPGSLKFFGADAKGYARRDEKEQDTPLGDAFSRYLPPLPDPPSFCRRAVADDVFPDNAGDNSRRQDEGATSREGGSVAGGATADGGSATSRDDGSVAGSSRENKDRDGATAKIPPPGEGVYPDGSRDPSSDREPGEEAPQ